MARLYLEELIQKSQYVNAFKSNDDALKCPKNSFLSDNNIRRTNKSHIGEELKKNIKDKTKATAFNPYSALSQREW